MSRLEFRAAGSLAAVFSVRLLGLFMIYPVFAAYAEHLSGATPYLVGEALGIYGLSQGLLQIPFGLLSDRFGRKPMIIVGLILFAIGSAVAALSTSIGGVIFGRVLQGTGAVGSVILALVADLTTEENRTKAMAMVGITIGGSFMVALVTGPILATFIGVCRGPRKPAPPVSKADLPMTIWVGMPKLSGARPAETTAILRSPK